jgi:hypothetical protein
MEKTEVWVNRQDLRDVKTVRGEVGAIADGTVLVAVDKFALTANNVSYATSGETLGYWDFFPAEEGWGIVPVWGMAEVVESRCAGIDVGERLYGYWPMASHAVLTPGRVKPASFSDVAAHRKELAAVYNQYRRMSAEDPSLQKIENERSLLFPLFITSYLLADYLQDNAYFDSKQVLIGSVSSKTGFGLAAFLKGSDFSGEVVGLTSQRNVGFVRDLDVCTQIVTYDALNDINTDKPGVFVDMSGDGPLAMSLHEGLGDNMKQSIAVGATHWDTARAGGALPGPKPEFFFAPSQIAKRDQEWGPGVLMDKANAACADLAQQILGNVRVEFVSGADQACQIWCEMLDNKVSPDRGIMVSL